MPLFTFSIYPSCPQCTYHQVDITNYSSLSSALQSCDIVFHTASFGMSGREMLNKVQTRRVNILGTRAIVRACVENKIPYLVYTSTFNVVFGGQPIYNGDESLPYFPLDKHTDEYSRTKAVAEIIVLKADRTPFDADGQSNPSVARRPNQKSSHSKITENGIEQDTNGMLRTCALRAAGIYGEGEERHFPRMYVMLIRHCCTHLLYC